MTEQKKTFWNVIEILNRLDLLEYVVIVGSWAEYLYEESNYFDFFISSIRTTDVDILVKNIRKPDKKVDLLSEFEKNDFDIMFDNSGITRLLKNHLEVEFLVREMGPGQVEPYDILSLGLKGEGLRYMDYLIDYSIPVEVNGYKILIPAPAAYVIHKLIIHQDRKEEKKEKDLRAIENMLTFIRRNEKELALVKSIYAGLPKKAMKRVDEVCRDTGIIL